MAGISKAERERRAQAKREQEELLAKHGLHCIPTCKVCRKAPDKIKEYSHYDNPLKHVLAYERLTRDGKFYCTTCYVKAGMPLF